MGVLCKHRQAGRPAVVAAWTQCVAAQLSALEQELHGRRACSSAAGTSAHDTTCRASSTTTAMRHTPPRKTAGRNAPVSSSRAQDSPQQQGPTGSVCRATCASRSLAAPCASHCPAAAAQQSTPPKQQNARNRPACMYTQQHLCLSSAQRVAARQPGPGAHAHAHRCTRTGAHALEMRPAPAVPAPTACPATRPAQPAPPVLHNHGRPRAQPPLPCCARANATARTTQHPALAARRMRIHIRRESASCIMQRAARRTCHSHVQHHGVLSTCTSAHPAASSQHAAAQLLQFCPAVLTQRPPSLQSMPHCRGAPAPPPAVSCTAARCPLSCRLFSRSFSFTA